MANPEIRVNEMLSKLKERGHRVTPQRMAILRTLARNQDHPSIEDIHIRVKADFPMTSLATVYKTVALLEEMGEVQELGLVDNVGRYDATKPLAHPHMICTSCGSIVDLHGVDLNETVQEVADAMGYEVRGNRVAFWGLCPKCRSSKQCGAKIERK